MSDKLLILSDCSHHPALTGFRTPACSSSPLVSAACGAEPPEKRSPPRSPVGDPDWEGKRKNGKLQEIPSLRCGERGSARGRKRRRKKGQRGKRTPGPGGAAGPCAGSSLLLWSERQGRAACPGS